MKDWLKEIPFWLTLSFLVALLGVSDPKLGMAGIKGAVTGNWDGWEQRIDQILAG